MKILVINCGSSSLKFQLINSEDESVEAKGLCERIGIDGSFTFKPSNGDSYTKEVDMPTHSEAMSTLISALTDPDNGVISDMSEISAVGHRIVHGGEDFTESVIIDDNVIAKIEECVPLAPLHNPANIVGIKSCLEYMPDTPNVAVFDTAFHHTMPESAYLYAIPYKYYRNYKIRRYGFHGTSHSFVSKRVAEIMNEPYEELKTIVCHLGNGASICAVKDGESIDTSMGLTPLAGIAMGTRSGDIDPGILEVIAKKENINVCEVTNILNKESGVYGLSGISSDFRDITKAISEGSEAAMTAIDVYVTQIVRFIGAYVAILGGVDDIVFTAGIGENTPLVRQKVCDRLKYLGIELNYDHNNVRGEEMMISTENSPIKVFVIPTNEELAIARETVALIS